MKKFLSLFLILFVSITCLAQLTVNSSGNVKVSKRIAIGDSTTFDSYSDLKLDMTTSNLTHYNIYSKLVSPLPMGSYRHVAVFGNCYLYTPFLERSVSDSLSGSRLSINPFCAGVAGISAKGIGVYGATALDLPTNWGMATYAGYFGGNVKVTGTTTANSFVTSSDMRLKENIVPFTSTFKQNLLSLSPVSFNYTNDTISPSSKNDNSINKLTPIHYGFLAQQVKSLYPDLVYEDEAGYLAVNYIELIPIMIEHIKELTERVEDLEDSRLSSREQVRKAESAAVDNGEIIPTLLQNSPNPFSESTTIRYILPEQTKQASIYLYDMSGVQLAKYPLESRGEGQIIIEGRTLKAGMYLYSLIADNEVVDTKQMILTK